MVVHMPKIPKFIVTEEIILLHKLINQSNSQAFPLYSPQHTFPQSDPEYTQANS